MTNIPKIVIGSLLVVWVVIITNSCFGQSQRTKANINQGWQYLESATTSSKEALSSNLWIPVDLPHSWNSLDATDLVPGYRRSASWYSKIIELKKKLKKVSTNFILKELI